MAGPSLANAYRALSGLFVMTDAHGSAFHHFRRLIEVAEISGKDKGVVLYGPSGSGKSTTLRQVQDWVAERFPSEAAEDLFPIVQMPGKVTPASFAKEVLTAVLDPFAERGTGADAERRLMSVASGLRAKAIAFDEFHNLFDDQLGADAGRTAKTLKNFINAFKRPVIIAGLESICGFIQSSKELRRRCDRYFSLHQFDLQHDAHALDYLRLLDGIEAVLPSEPDARPSDAVMRVRIWLATQGNTGDIIELAKGACEEAMNRHADAVGLVDYSTCFRRTGRAVAGDKDPFVLRPEQVSGTQVPLRRAA